MNPKIAVAVSDVFFSARIRETAAQLGVPTIFVGKAEQVLEVVEREDPCLLIIDLNDARFDAVETVRAIKGSARVPSTRILGFLSHVQAELAESARGAGCDQVMARSRFTQLLPQLLRDAIVTPRA